MTLAPALREQFRAVAEGRHGDPFAILGIHSTVTGRVVRSLQPQASGVTLLCRNGDERIAMQRVHPGGLYEAELPPRIRRYQLQIDYPAGPGPVIDDPYSFPSTLGELDLHLLAEGAHQQLSQTLGAVPLTVNGISGTRFAVWAPNASRVSVVGSFNDWDGRRHPMRRHPGNGVWEIFLPAVGHGSLYKFELLDKDGRLLPLKSDPLARFCEAPPGNAAVVFSSDYAWGDQEWMRARHDGPRLDQPLCIYEVHPGSWKRRPEHGHRYLTWDELSVDLIDYARDMGFSHIELLPVTEHPFDGSWGYQPIGLYAPTQRFGNPDDFRRFVDRCHQAGIGVILDWVPAHFPRDEHGLGRFDGSALYEHADPRKGEHADWGTLIFNFGRREVVNYLIGSALYWIDEMHVDGLRVDAVASMLYLDYSRKEGEWLPNRHGGNENLEAVEFLKQFNEIIHKRGAISLAEESTSWPGVSRPVFSGGLGFTYKWNMGWMNDSLRYVQEDPIHRKFHHDKLTFGLVYAFDENFVLPLSHDEVVHGKRSMLGRMPGDHFQRFANLRAYYGFMYGHPGKKLLFMGNEIAQGKEWNHDASLDWHLLDDAAHRGVQALVRDLNFLYRRYPALHELDVESAGFEWLDWQDKDHSIFAWLRRDRSGRHVVCISNMTPVVRHDYRAGVPAAGRYRELLNTDRVEYGGSGICNEHAMPSEAQAAQNQAQSVRLTLPPLATLFLAIDD
jgi:1,4-alpha-glucan branching enzyme